jgi:hypothetical protein
MTLLLAGETRKDLSPEELMTLREVEEQILETKREMIRLQQQKEETIKARRLWFFVPNPKQMEFFERSGTKRRAGFCGNRFGKSTIGVVEDVCWLIGYRPFFAVGHPLRTQGIPKHGVKGLVLAEDWDKVKEIFTNEDSQERQGKFWEYLPADFVKKIHRNEKGIVDQITVSVPIDEDNPDGPRRESIVYFDTVKSYKQAPASFESSDWDFIHVDEPVMKELWSAVSRGLIDRGGYSWWLLTPIKEVWMYNEMVENALKDPHLYWWFEATMDDNPLLSEEDKQLYLSQLPEDERAARRAGKPLAYGRLVFSMYEPDVHLFDGIVPGWDRVSVPPRKDHMVVYAIDTHPQTPHAGLFIAINNRMEIDVYDELWEKGTIAHISGIIKTKTEGTRVEYALCEPGAWNEDQGGGKTYMDLFTESGLSFIPGSKRKEDAILLLQQFLKQRTRPVRIHKRCTQLRKEFINHFFDKDNKPEDKNDHVIECFRRLVLHDNLIYYPESFSAASGKQFSSDTQLGLGKQYNDPGLGLGRLNLTKI